MNENKLKKADSLIFCLIEVIILFNIQPYTLNVFHQNYTFQSKISWQDFKYCHI